MKIHLTFTPTVPGDDSMQDERQVYSPRKIEEIEQIKERDGLAKWLTMYVMCQVERQRSTRCNNHGCGIAALTTGLGTPLCIALEGIALDMGLGQASLTKCLWTTKSEGTIA